LLFDVKFRLELLNLNTSLSDLPLIFSVFLLICRSICIQLGLQCLTFLVAFLEFLFYFSVFFVLDGIFGRFIIQFAHQ
jgi:hypothetical protein